MADSVDRVFVHALSTIRKVPSTGSTRPPPEERLRLYGLYKQSMEGDVEGVMTRPSAESGTEEKGAVEKWDAWQACAGLSRTEAKRRYISKVIRMLHAYASDTIEGRTLVQELEFVWDQVRSNYETQLASEEERRRRRSSSGRREVVDESGLRVLRPLSENEVEAGAPGAIDDPDNNGGIDRGMDDRESFTDARSYSSRGSRRSQLRYSRSPSPVARAGSGPGRSSGVPRDLSPDGTTAEHWRRRVSRALVQLTAEVAALRELADGSSTSALGRYFARSRRRRRGLLLKVWAAIWQLGKRILVDAAVLACLLVILRWRWRAKVESAWELLGVWLGFISDEVRGKLKDGVREGLKMGQGVGLIGAAARRGERGANTSAGAMGGGTTA